jgi:hypothetical protein
MPTPALDLTFPHDYSVELLPDAASAAPLLPFAVPPAPEAVESLYVKVTPAGDPAWVGAFARGFATDDLVSGIYAWPDGISLAVVASGYGYVVRAHDPRSWIRLQPNPITDVRVIPEHKLILFADFTHLYAYGAERNAWKTERLSWDGITLTQLASNHLFGIAWDAMQDKEVEFAVDLRTGEHTGGARPWAKR